MSNDVKNVPFVATDLIDLDWPIMPTSLQDIEIERKVYRPLTPEYFAWLRHQMQKARNQTARGKMLAANFDALRTRFNALLDRAIDLFGESALEDAFEAMDPKTYSWPGRAGTESESHTHAEIPKEQSPSPRCSLETPGIPDGVDSLDGLSKHACPDEDPERYRFNQPVSKYALTQVDAIRYQALALGWTEAQLYQTRGRFAFPCGSHYGLVCFIHRNQRLGEVTNKSIEIICSGDHSLHFYRKEVSK
jgi:hypothetical protein